MADDSQDALYGKFGQRLADSCFVSKREETTSSAVLMDPADEYNFCHPVRGIALIITNSKFQNAGERAGANNDTKLFYKTFQHLGFTDIRIAQDLTVSEMMLTLRSIANEKQVLQNSDCIAIAFSSHGDVYQYLQSDKPNVLEDTIFGIDNQVRTRELLEMFTDSNCPELTGKPRLFFIQACRGSKLDVGVEIMDVPDSITDVTDSLTDVSVSPAPCFKDFLVFYATPPGYYAFRRPSEGSWFVKCLCDITLKADLENMSLSKIMTRVINKVSYDYMSEHSHPMLNAKKQSPCLYSMLVKDVYFRKKQAGKEESMEF